MHKTYVYTNQAMLYLHTHFLMSTRQRLFCVHTVSSIYNNPLLTG